MHETSTPVLWGCKTNDASEKPGWNPHLRCADDPGMIRDWTLQSATRPSAELTFCASGTPAKKHSISFNRPSPKKVSPCQQRLRLPQKVTPQQHIITLTSPNIAPATEGLCSALLDSTLLFKVRRSLVSQLNFLWYQHIPNTFSHSVCFYIYMYGSVFGVASAAAFRDCRSLHLLFLQNCAI